MASDLNQVSGDNSTSGGMVVLLAIFGLSIVSYALIQNELNSFAR
jgi:hypothetical protein